jgi:hypothetical protein
LPCCCRVDQQNTTASSSPTWTWTAPATAGSAAIRRRGIGSTPAPSRSPPPSVVPVPPATWATIDPADHRPGHGALPGHRHQSGRGDGAATRGRAGLPCLSTPRVRPPQDHPRRLTHRPGPQRGPARRRPVGPTSARPTPGRARRRPDPESTSVRRLSESKWGRGSVAPRRRWGPLTGLQRQGSSRRVCSGSVPRSDLTGFGMRAASLRPGRDADPDEISVENSVQSLGLGRQKFVFGAPLVTTRLATRFLKLHI